MDVLVPVRLVDTSKELTQEGRFSEARDILAKAVALLEHAPDESDSRLLRATAYAHYQRAVLTLRQLDSVGFSVSATDSGSFLAPDAFFEALTSCDTAASHYQKYFGDDQCEHCQDARAAAQMLMVFQQLALELQGPMRNPSLPIEAFCIEMAHLPWLPNSEPEALEHKQVIAVELMLSSFNVPDYKCADGSVWWPPSPLAVFLCGPFCTVAGEDVASLRDWIAQTFDTDISYPPLEYLLSCPGCATRVDSIEFGFLGLEYASCFSKDVCNWFCVDNREASPDFSLDGFTMLTRQNKVLPRCFCLRCVRDLIVPLCVGIDLPPHRNKWAHQEGLTLDSVPPMFTAFNSWQTGGTTTSDTDAVKGDRLHSVEHFYYWMENQDEYCRGGAILGRNGGEIREVIAKIIGCMQGRMA